MANRTAKHAVSIRGTNPQFLIHPMIRTRIYESKYWKEHCTLLNSALVLERAVDDLKYVGGIYGGNTKTCPFLCLTLKLLQIQPQREIIYLYIDQPDFKYLRALGALYLRFTGTPVEIYSRLEPLFKDYRKLRMMDTSHKFSVIHMDELIDNLLREENLFGLTLPRLTKRAVLEDNRDIEPYKSELEDLIPTQIIEEKVERQKVEERRDKRHSSSHHSRHGDDYRSSSSSHHRSHRHRSRSPKETSKYPKVKCRFSQEEIDNENAIRAKIGLKPLR